jgi:hypothetical protein
MKEVAGSGSSPQSDGACRRCLMLFCRWLAVAVIIAAGGVSTPLLGTQIRVPSGTLVRLKLHYDLTTENVLKDDRIDFDVADDVVVNKHVVFPKGAVAWGKVIRVKGAGKKKAKDASVTFRFIGVRSIDNQQVPLRLLPSKPKKADSRENLVEINTPIPGLRERMIGAPKGKEYAAYTDTDALVNAPEPTPPKPATPAAASTLGAQTVVGAAPATPAVPAMAAALLPPEDATVDFDSTPGHAAVLVDGIFRANTPFKLTLPPGRHVIEVRLEGYRPWTRHMVVNAGSMPSVRARLEKQE